MHTLLLVLSLLVVQDVRTMSRWMWHPDSVTTRVTRQRYACTTQLALDTQGCRDPSSVPQVRACPCDLGVSHILPQHAERMLLFALNPSLPGASTVLPH